MDSDAGFGAALNPASNEDFVRLDGRSFSSEDNDEHEPVLSSTLLEEHSDSTLTTLSTPQNDILISQHLQLPGKGSAIWSIFAIVLSTVWQLYSIQCRPQ
jgi:hypothetical protein